MKNEKEAKRELLEIPTIQRTQPKKAIRITQDAINREKLQKEKKK